MRKRILTFTAAAACAFALLTGCQNKENTQTDKTSDTETSETVTVTDARQEVKIPSDPKTIVDLSGNSDILSILGYTVAGTANSDAYDYTKFPAYLEDTLKDAKILGYSMQDTMDMEGILDLEPDLIIISSVQEKMYRQLTKIAPTVMLELAQTNWKGDVNAVAKVMKKEDKANSWLKDYEEKASQTGAKIRETYGEDTTYLALLASGDNSTSSMRRESEVSCTKIWALKNLKTSLYREVSACRSSRMKDFLKLMQTTFHDRD